MNRMLDPLDASRFSEGNPVRAPGGVGTREGSELSRADLKLFQAWLSTMLPESTPEARAQRVRIQAWLQRQLEPRTIFRPAGDGWLIGCEGRPPLHHGLPAVLRGAYRAMCGQAVPAAQYAASKTPGISVRAQLARAADRLSALGYRELATALRPPLMRVIRERIVFDSSSPRAPRLEL